MNGSVRGDLHEPLAPRRHSLLQVPPRIERAIGPVVVAAAAAPRSSTAGPMSSLYQDHHRNVGALTRLFHELLYRHDLQKCAGLTETHTSGWRRFLRNEARPENGSASGRALTSVR